MKNFFLSTALLIICFPVFSQKTIGYKIFNEKGKPISFEKLVSEASKADIILFGEYHNNAISHWLQYELTKTLASKKNVVLGAEMFESDNQKVLNQFLQNEIDEKALDTLARVWKNYKTDYAPLVRIAKEQKTPFIATNIPRKYANLVYKKGFEGLDSLPQDEKQWLAPLPIEFDPELPCYRDILKMDHGHANANLPKAQAVKDATMAYFIMKNFTVGTPFIHYNGSYHSDNYQGIVWYLKRMKPELNYLTITTVQQENPNKLNPENKHLADVIICVDEHMTPTH